MRVAVVRNRENKGIINRFGQPCPEVYGRKTVQNVIDGLREGGHSVGVYEGDMNLLADLMEFMPPDPGSDRPAGMVFNMAYGIQGECRYAHVPAILEMGGVPYTGSGPLGHALALDKVIAKILMRQAGIPTPAFRVMSLPGEDVGSLRFPLVVKPRHESTSYGLYLADTHSALEEAVLSVVSEYRQDALVEEFVPGREVCVAILGNGDSVETFPIVELDFGGRDLQLNTWADKYHKQPDEPSKVCPAPIDDDLAVTLRDMAVSVFRACRCRDYSRVDIRLDTSGDPYVLEINSMASLGAGGSYVLAANTAGYTSGSLACRILDVAHERYYGEPAPRHFQGLDS